MAKKPKKDKNPKGSGIDLSNPYSRYALFHADFQGGNPYSNQSQVRLPGDTLNVSGTVDFTPDGIDTSGQGYVTAAGAPCIPGIEAGLTGLTIEAVVMSKGNGSSTFDYGAIFSIYYTASLNSIEFIDQGGDADNTDLFFRIRSGGSNTYITTSGDFLLPYESFKHVVAVFDGSKAAANRYKIYVNGVDTGGTVTGTPPTSVPTDFSSADADIGFWDVSNKYWNGTIQQVTVYKKAFNNSAVRTMHNSLAYRPLARNTGVVSQEAAILNEAANGGWSAGDVAGVANANISTVDTVAKANISTINTV